MHLARRTLFLAFAATLAACSENTGPKTVTGEFVLRDINGRALPTFLAPTPGLTPTVVDASLLLDNAGHASWTEDRIQFDGTPARFATTYDYEIRGKEIFFKAPCPANANCVAPPHGTISLSTGNLDLEIGHFGSEVVVYHFRRFVCPNCS